jgi:hypothetical protein
MFERLKGRTRLLKKELAAFGWGLYKAVTAH